MILNLKEFGTILSTRDLGEVIRENVLQGIDNENTVTIDFTNVSQITHSCADEIFAKLVMELGLANFKKSVNMINTDETTATIIKYVIAQRLENERLNTNKN